MARTVIVNGRIYESTGLQSVIIGGIYEETAGTVAQEATVTYAVTVSASQAADATAEGATSNGVQAGSTTAPDLVIEVSTTDQAQPGSTNAATATAEASTVDLVNLLAQAVGQAMVEAGITSSQSLNGVFVGRLDGSFVAPDGRRFRVAAKVDGLRVSTRNNTFTVH